MYYLRAVAILAVVALDVASFGQQATDPMTTLRHIGQRLLADVDRMPRYTCVQTITRTFARTSGAKPHSHTSACAALIAARDAEKHTPPMLGWDRLRLEVALVEGKSVFSWVGAPRFSDDTVDKLAGNGPLGSGDFGIFISDILRRATLDFQGEQVVDGTRLMAYSYDMPLEKSSYRVKTEEGWTVTAYSGTFLLDPQANDLVKLTVRTAELPENSSACQAASEITYGRTDIHDRLVLIPRETILYAINRSGIEARSLTSFANCREYTSTVRLLLDGSRSTAGTGETSPAAEPSAPLPAGLLFDARIVTPIDSDTAAIGDPLEAVLRSPMRDKNKAVIAPDGARLHGRLTNVRWWSEPSENFQITVRFESVEIAGRNVPFSATLEQPRLAVFTGTGLSVSRTMQLQPDDPSLGGTFFFHQQHLHLKSLDAQWVTVAPSAGIEKK